jgi:CheY-like chemotaxis protein
MLDPDVGSVQGDPVRLQQIVGNILSNAVKFTPRGGTVTVVLRRIDAQAEITITDTGQGIAPEFLPDVFKQFQQADASTSRKHGGLGLGMAIVKHLVELHAGMVQAESPGQGKGATFRVLLPLATEGLEETEIPRSPKPATSKTDGGDLTSLRGIRILLVDDSPDARQLIKRVLEDHEAQVVAAESAGEALAEIERSHPNVLISDIGLPGKDGYELIREVRKLPPERGGMMPAVALTALVQPPDRLRALAAGYQVHIAKPIEPSPSPLCLTAFPAVTGPAGRSEKLRKCVRRRAKMPAQPLIPCKKKVKPFPLSLPLVSRAFVTDCQSPV